MPDNTTGLSENMAEPDPGHLRKPQITPQDLRYNMPASPMLLDLIHARRSVRRFNLDQPVDSKQIDTILDAAIWAPSGTNQQELRFVIILEPTLLDEFACFKRIRAPVVILIYLDTEAHYAGYSRAIRRHPHKRPLPYIDTGLAMMNMMLTAQALGLASVPLNVSNALFRDASPSRHLPQRILKRLAVAARASWAGIQFFANFTQRLAIDTHRYRPTGSIALGYSHFRPNLTSARHGGRPLQRADLDTYVLGRYV